MVNVESYDPPVGEEIQPIHIGNHLTSCRTLLLFKRPYDYVVYYTYHYKSDSSAF